MKVDELQLEHFRNYKSLFAQFSPGVNVIYGDNAQGKTNLLEAVAYLAGAKSHRARSDRELISFQQPGGRVYANVESRQRPFQLEIRLSRVGRRQITSNGVRLKTAGELNEILSTVFFCPEDLYLIREGAAARRRFLDRSICQLRPRYAQALAEYNRLYEHKTRILRDWQEKPSLLDTLEEFNIRMAQCGAQIIHYRAHYIRKLREFAPNIHREFSGGQENLELDYTTVSTVLNPEGTVGEIYQQLLNHQISHRRAELESRSCLSGPHKDDLIVNLNGVSAKTYGSQGQTRTAALSLKLAEREIAHQDLEEYPILLLDDVLSELDPRRQNFVLNHIEGGQVFITCCEDERLETRTEGKVFHIHQGAIV